ncbi:hypothetical protein Hanom_Chr04g00288141 [Helianthus anomalus]
MLTTDKVYRRHFQHSDRSDELQFIKDNQEPSSQKIQRNDPPRKLIGALGNSAYVAPKDDKWRHNDSQSDDEEPELKRKMIEKFGPDPVDSDMSESGDDDDDDDDDDGGGGGGGDDGGDTGAVGASSAGAAGDTSAGGNDEPDSDSDDHIVEPGYEMYLDEHGVKRYRRIRQEDDPEYVPSDTEAERLKKRKAEKAAAHQKKKKARKYLSTSAQQSVPQEPVQETHVISSTPETPVASPAAETPTVTPQAVPQRSMAAAIRATTSQPSADRQRIFSEMS